MLEITAVSKSYKDHKALHTIDMSVRKGCIYGLIGQNGAGKTTLIRIVNKIIESDSGRVLFNGKPITIDDIKKIGYLPEERGLYKNMSIKEQALYFGQLKGLTKAQSLKNLDEWLLKFGLVENKHHKIQQLSKGMAQKVQFIITVLHEPELLILDEPFSGFDPVNAKLIADEIKHLAKGGTTIIFSSHRMESVEEMCDEICLLHKGKVLLQNTIQNIKEQYAQKEYKVVLEDYDKEDIEKFISDYNVMEQEEVNRQFVLKLSGVEVDNDLLKELTTLGKIKSYQEILPSLEDVFIKTIAYA